jgi:hypothetical protein
VPDDPNGNYYSKQIVSLQGDDISRVTTAAKIVERMVNQNTYDDIAQGLFERSFSLICCNYFVGAKADDDL